MRFYRHAGWLLLTALLLALPAESWAQGECVSEGAASVELDVNNVRAALYPNGNLFYAASALYEVPKGSGQQSVFASGIWIGGLADGELRMAAATYSNFEFRPGPLAEDGSHPTDCAPFDRMWKVNATDIAAFEAGEPAARDLAEWPVELGAPVIDGDGVPGNYNLSGGDRPEILGDQSVWWVMNDVSAPHNTTNTPPIGLEAKVLAFAFNQAGALGNTTFYRYRFTYRGEDTLEDVYLGVWVDPDLGGAGDDYVGSDSTLGLGYVYNGTPTDGTYGDFPPALGYDFFQGPLVNNDGIDNDDDGTVDEDDERLAMEKFVFYNNDSTPQGNPDNAEEYYGYLRGFWRDGVPITFGGSGRGFSEEPADYMFPADPPEFWSEFNVDGEGSANAPADRRFVQSTGPFTLEPGDTQEIVFGIVWSQDTEATSNPNIASVEKLKQDDFLAQQVFDIGFQLPPPPDAPQVSATEQSEAVTLTWQYAPNSNNYLGSYEAENPLISDVDDLTYNFEGFIVYQFDGPQDTEGERIAVFDEVNGITQILLENPNGTVVEDVTGSDSGLQYSLRLPGLTNYTDYFYGVQAYAYNEFSSPKTYKSPIRRVTVTPSPIAPKDGGTLVDDEARGERFSTGAEDESPFNIEVVSQLGQGDVNVEVVDPSQVTGADYTVEFGSVSLDDGEGHSSTFVYFDVLRNGEVVVDGEQFVRNTCNRTGSFVLENCKGQPRGEDLFVLDGLSFSITGPDPGPLVIDGFNMFVELVGPGGVDPCPEGDTSFGCAETGGDLVELSFNSTGEYVLYHNGPEGSEGTLAGYAPRDFEIRFGPTSYAYHPFTTGAAMEVPFQVWDIGIEGTGENDPSDDVQMIPNIFSDNGGECEFDTAEDPGNPFGLDGFTGTDRIYAYYSTTTYEDWAAAIGPVIDADPEACPEPPATDEAAGFVDFGSGRPIQREVLFSVFDSMDSFDGTVIRYLTTKPHQPGDTFTFDTGPFAAQRGVATEDEMTREEILDNIGIVPNPYMGASTYETSQIVDVVRFTGLPEEASIRIFTLNGKLIRQLEKNSPSTFLEWDLQTEDALPIASGMYLIHVDVPDLGERVLKFGVVKKQVQLNEL